MHFARAFRFTAGSLGFRGLGEVRYIDQPQFYHPEDFGLPQGYKAAARAEVECGGMMSKAVGRVAGTRSVPCTVWVEPDRDAVAFVTYDAAMETRSVLLQLSARALLAMQPDSWGYLELTPIVTHGKPTDLYAMELGCSVADGRNVQNAVALVRDRARFPEAKYRQSYADWKQQVAAQKAALSGLDAFRVGVKDPAIMTAGEINTEQERLAAESSRITAEMIAAGRGWERPSERVGMTDPLTVRWREVSDRQQALYREGERRMGTRYYGKLPVHARPIKPWGGFEGIDGMRRQPTRAALDALIRAKAELRAAVRGAPLEIEAKMHKRYYAALQRVLTQIGASVLSPENEAGLDAAATEYARKHIIGPGISW